MLIQNHNQLKLELHLQVASIFKQWVNVDSLRGSWGRLALNKAWMIFDKLRQADSSLIIAPTSAHYEITNQCNSHCIHCQRWNWKDLANPSLEQAILVFQHLSSLGVKTLTIGGGEPLLYRHLPKLLDLNKEYGFRLGIITNGLFSSPPLLKSLCDNVEWVRFSLDASDDETYKTIRGIHDGFSMAMSTIKQVVLLRRHNRTGVPKIGINFVVQAENVRQLPEIIRKAEENEVDMVLFKLVHGKGPFLLSHTQLARLKLDIESLISTGVDSKKNNLLEFHQMITRDLDSNSILSGFPIHSFYKKKKLRCFAPFFFLTIDSRGYVYPCDYLFYDTRGEVECQKSRLQYKIGHVKDFKVRTSDTFQKLGTILNRLSCIDVNTIPECGCCTRFYRFNLFMNLLYDEYDRLRRITTHREAVQLFKAAIKAEVRDNNYGWL